MSTFTVTDQPVARPNDPVTSYIAGENIASREASEAEVLAILRMAGMPYTDDMIWQARLGTYTPQRLRTARAQLVRKGLVEAAGTRPGASPTGRSAMTWKLVQS